MSFPGKAIGEQTPAGGGPFTGNERFPITGSRSMSLLELRTGYLNEFYIQDSLSNLPGGPLILSVDGTINEETQLGTGTIRANKLKLSPYFWENASQQLDIVDLSIPASVLDNDSSVPGVSIMDALDDLQAQVNAVSSPIMITNFSLTPATYTYEIGLSVAPVTVNWTVDYITLAAATLTLPGGGSVDVTATTISGSGTASYVYSVPMSGSTKTFTLQVDDGATPPISQNINVRFYPRVHWGVSTLNPAPDSSFILGLSGSNLQNSSARTFTVTPGASQYIYYCYPDSFGDVAFWVGGFEGGFELVDTFLHTNAQGYQQNYRVYRSTNPNLGETTVSVTSA